VKSKYVEQETIKAIKGSLDEQAWLPLWVALETGLRVGDVVALRRASLKEDGIHYRAQKTNKCGVAKISAELRRQLPTKGKWLFPSPYKQGEHITRQCVWARIKRAAKRAGLNTEGVSPHTLRKVFAVELYREKGFKAVQTALQHSNAATTEIYSFADWSTGSNADEPLRRRDLQLIIKMVIEALGDAYNLPKESKKRPKSDKNASKTNKNE
jgi:integrase